MTTPMIIDKVMLADELFQEVSSLLTLRLNHYGFTDPISIAVIKTTLVQLLIAEIVSPFDSIQQSELKRIMMQ